MPGHRDCFRTLKSVQKDWRPALQAASSLALSGLEVVALLVLAHALHLMLVHPRQLRGRVLRQNFPPTLPSAMSHPPLYPCSLLLQCWDQVCVSQI